jgi:LDH2 family malate/lactate/ureidoglycolate dehydrogenase
MISITADKLSGIAARILMAAGADERNAARVAEALVSANVCGVDTHGVYHLPGYVAAIKAGELLPTAWPEILSETPISALVGGNWTFGHVTAKFAMEVAIVKAQRDHVAIVSAVQINHSGRLGEYVEMAAAQGMISLIWAGGFGEEDPETVPYGGRKRILHTNPIAIGCPSSSRAPMIVDYATTAVAGIKVWNAREKNEPLPPGCIVDKEGNPTTDASAFFAGGAHLPFGGHKGYALMLTAEILGRVFSGADNFSPVPFGGIRFRHCGTTMIVFRADLFQPLEEYCKRAEELGNRVRTVPPAAGFKEVLIPGDLEARARRVREREGIPIPENVWQRLVDLAASLGLKEI